LRDEIRQLENEELGLPVHEQKAPIMGRSTRASRGRARRGSARARSSRAGARRTDRRGQPPHETPHGGRIPLQTRPSRKRGDGRGPARQGPKVKAVRDPNANIAETPGRVGADQHSAMPLLPSPLAERRGLRELGLCESKGLVGAG
jgi:hypothetical protein